MQPMSLTKQPCGTWTVDLVGSNHLFQFDTVDNLEFVAMGFDSRAIRFTITPQGVLEQAVEVTTGRTLDQLNIPYSHSLRRDVTIGKPFKGK